MNNILEIDLDKKLEIKINNRNPVALKDLSLSLLSFNHQFHKFIESETSKETEVSTELLIKEVRKGSIVIELVSQAAPIVPLLWEGERFRNGQILSKAFVTGYWARPTIPQRSHKARPSRVE
ncbi:hypothetical protein [Shewanella dokdonensis]|uniref:hypothetical protein n=1 Tax=Shewanella dokdonensis TaxID=712036 RepID=UPI001FD2FC0F|nr:hypothetical protein [Shewanella dokdonensis]